MNSNDQKSDSRTPEETKANPGPMTAVPAVQSAELTDEELRTVAGGTGQAVATNLTNQRHDLVKSIVQNLRG